MCVSANHRINHLRLCVCVCEGEQRVLLTLGKRLAKEADENWTVSPTPHFAVMQHLLVWFSFGERDKDIKC